VCVKITVISSCFFFILIDICKTVGEKIIFHVLLFIQERVNVLEAHVEEARKRMIQFELLKQVSSLFISK
jgi:hypothetical protein